ncbi:MAG: OpgC family protein, partial [Candidatus Limnocylindria bacterium]
LDFFRGLALFCIFLDHLPNSFLTQFTLQSFMFSDAAEVFILISGYTAGMVYGQSLERQGFLVAAVRIAHRVWQLYVAHVFLFMIFMATVAYTVGTLNSSLYAEEFAAADFLNEPGVAVIKALTLQFQPAYMDILPLYIVLLGAFPFMLAGFRSWPRLVLGASLALWVAAQLDPRLALPAYPGPDRVWFFNPLAWQALFFVGAWLGWHGIRHKLSWLDRGWLLGPLAGLALAASVVRFSWTLHPRYHLGSSRFLWLFLSKRDLGLLRFANVLGLAVLVRRLISPRAPFLAGPVAWPFVICGRHSLHIFCLGILLAVLGHLVLREFFGGRLMQLAVSMIGVAIMVAVAALMDWFA